MVGVGQGNGDRYRESLRADHTSRYPAGQRMQACANHVGDTRPRADQPAGVGLIADLLAEAFSFFTLRILEQDR
jgi:hypothetical protein